VAEQPGASGALSVWARNFIAAPRYPPEQRLSLVTDDGVRLAAVRLATCIRPHAAIVLIHGLTNWSRNPRIHRFAHDLARRAEVIVPDLRGHGGSQGRCSLGRDEPLDVAAAVSMAAASGLPVVTVGVSMGGVATLLHAGRFGGVAGTVAISAPAGWVDLTTHGATRIRRYVSSQVGRVVLAALCRTRVARGMPVMIDDAAAAIGAIAPAFTVLVHDRADKYFPAQHATQLLDWAREPKELWWTEGAGHGTDLLTTELADRILTRLRQ